MDLKAITVGNGYTDYLVHYQFNSVMRYPTKFTIKFTNKILNNLICIQ